MGSPTGKNKGWGKRYAWDFWPSLSFRLADQPDTIRPADLQLGLDSTVRTSMLKSTQKPWTLATVCPYATL